MNYQNVRAKYAEKSLERAKQRAMLNDICEIASFLESEEFLESENDAPLGLTIMAEHNLSMRTVKISSHSAQPILNEIRRTLHRCLEKVIEEEGK